MTAFNMADGLLHSFPMRWLYLSLLIWHSASHAGIPQYFQLASKCEQRLTSTNSTERKLKQISGSLELMRLNPARAIHPEEMTQILDLIDAAKNEVENLIDQPKVSDEFQRRNLTRFAATIQTVRAQLRKILTVFSGQTEMRESLTFSYNTLQGALYEAIVANRLREKQPRVGETVRRVYPQIQWNKSDRQKELDIIVPTVSGHDIWIETKYIHSEGIITDKEYGWIHRTRERLIEQLENMMRLRDMADPDIEVYLIASDNVNENLQKEISRLGIKLIQFPLARE